MDTFSWLESFHGALDAPKLTYRAFVQEYQSLLLGYWRMLAEKIKISYNTHTYSKIRNFFVEKIYINVPVNHASEKNLTTQNFFATNFSCVTKSYTIEFS